MNLKIESIKEVDYYDRDEIMLRACFQILKDFTEQELTTNTIDHDYHKKLVKEINFLNNWFQKRIEQEDFDDSDQDTRMLKRLMRIRTQLWT